jgi:hypothetical protein
MGPAGGNRQVTVVFEPPKSSHAPLHGIAIKAQSAAMKNTLLVFRLDRPNQHMKKPAFLGAGCSFDQRGIGF